MEMLDDGHDENSTEDLEKVICEIVLQQLKWKENISNAIDLDLGVFQELEAVVQSCSVKKMFLNFSQNSRENTCARASFLIKLQTLAQVFSREFCEIFKNTYFYGTPLVDASEECAHVVSSCSN